MANHDRLAKHDWPKIPHNVLAHAIAVTDTIAELNRRRDAGEDMIPQFYELKVHSSRLAEDVYLMLELLSRREVGILIPISTTDQSSP